MTIFLDTKSFDHTSLKLRCEPNSNQRLFLSQAIGYQRFVWKWALNLKKKEYKRWLKKGKPKDFKWLSFTDLCHKLIKLKHQNKWLNDIPAQPLQQTLRHLTTAFDRWFKGYSKHPVFKKFNRGGSVHFTNQNIKENQLRKGGNYLYITLPMNQGELKCKLHKPLSEGRLLKTIISKNSCNQYFVVLNYEVEEGSLLKQSTTYEANRCGIDLGVVKPLTIYTVDDNGKEKSKVLGKQVKRDLERLELRRKRYQRTYSRRYEAFKKRQKKVKPNKEGELERVSTQNLDKSRLMVAKAFQKEVNVRKDFAEKTSHYLASNFNVIKFEDIRLSSMSKKVKVNEDGSPRVGVKAKQGLNRELLRLGLASVVSLTEYKAKLYGNEVKFVDPKFTSQRCSNCGSISRDNRKSQSQFECVSCGFTLNADVNAAKNIYSRKPVDKPKLRKVA